jgi:hypothetical protein
MTATLPPLGSPADLEAMYFGPRPARAPLGDIGSPGASVDVSVTGGTPPAAVVLPPWVERPGASQDIFAISPPAVLVGPGPAAFWAVPAAIVTLLPPTHVGRLNVFGMQVLNMVPTSLISWTLRVNGGAAYPTLSIPAGALLVARDEREIFLRLRPGVSIDVMVRVDDVGVYAIQAYYGGWIYPSSYDRLYEAGKVLG